MILGVNKISNCWRPRILGYMGLQHYFGLFKNIQAFSANAPFHAGKKRYGKQLEFRVGGFGAFKKGV